MSSESRLSWLRRGIGLWLLSAAVCAVGDERPRDAALSYRPAARPAGLLLVLHGYSSGAAAIEHYLKLRAPAVEHGLIAAYPQGTRNHRGRRGWNAGEPFGNVYDHRADDTAYLNRLIAGFIARHRLHAAPVFVIGHSNGARMAYRLACTGAHPIAAIVAIAGAQLSDPNRACRSRRGVRVLQIHGRNDSVASYRAGTFAGRPHPGALSAARQWAIFNGCRLTTGDRSRSLSAGVSARRYRFCHADRVVELWTVNDAGHAPRPAGPPALGRRLIRWLLEPEPPRY